MGGDEGYTSTVDNLPVILVTGSSRGFGRGVAEHLASTRLNVAIHYVNKRDAAEATAQNRRAKALRAKQHFPIVHGDIATDLGRRTILKETLAAFGRLDALVNNAGIAPRLRADINQATEETFDEVISVNLKGPYFLSQLVVQHWLAYPGQSKIKGGYKLIFVSSLSANTASVNRGEYCISKAGLSMAAQLWAVRLAQEGIQVIELRPGIMATDMTAGVKEKYDALIAEGLIPQMRWGTPEDLGGAVESILSGAFPFSTGDIINVDGGFHLRRL